MVIVFIVIALLSALACVATVLYLSVNHESEYTEKLPPSGVLRKIALSVNFRRVNTFLYCNSLKRRFNRITKLLKNNARLTEVSDFLREIYNNAESVRSVICRGAAQLCKGFEQYKFSKIFGVCRLLVNSQRGNVPQSLLYQAIAEFEKCNKIKEIERNAVVCVNDLCLCEFLLGETEREIIEVNEFCRAENDDKTGRIDISSIQDAAYVAGLFGSGDNAKYYLSLFDANNVDINCLLENYARGCAERMGALSAVFDCFSAKISVAVSNDDGRAFGGEADYKTGLLSGNDTLVVADNRGAVSVSYCDIKHTLDCGVYIDGQYIELSSFDGIFQNHRAVYRTRIGTEFCFQFVCSPDTSCVLCRFTAIGGERSGPVRLRLSLSCGGIAEAEQSGDGIVCSSDKYAVGITSCGISKMSETMNGEMIVFDEELETSAFEKRDCVLSICFAKDRISIDGMFETVQRSFFDYAETAARSYARIANLPFETYAALCGNYKFDKAVAPVEIPTLVFDDNDMQTPLKLRYKLTALNRMGKKFTAIAVVTKNLFGLASIIGTIPIESDSDTARRARSIASNTKNSNDKPDYNELFLYKQNAVALCEKCDISFAEDKYAMEIKSESDDIPVIVLLLNGIAVMPFIKNVRTRAMLGYTEYSSRFGGNVFVLKAYSYRSKNTRIYDLQIQGEAVNPQMLFAVPSDAAPMRVEKVGNCIFAIGNSDCLCGYGICCSERIDDFTPYAEGYFSHGSILFDGTFRRGGNTLSPAISTRVNNGRVVFCVGAIDEIQGIYDFSVSNANEYLAQMTGIFGSAVCPLTSNDGLNRCYMQSLNRINEGFIFDRGLTECFVQMYYSPNTVRERIIEFCKSQYTGGQMSSFYSTLVFPLIVERYVMRTGDETFYNEKIEFADGECSSVLEHCLRAMYCAWEHCDRISAAVLYTCIKRYISVVQRSRREKLMEIANEIKRNSDGILRNISIQSVKDRTEEYIMYSLCVLSEKSAHSVLSFIAENLGDNFIENYGICFSLLYACALYRTMDSKRAYDVLRAVTEALTVGDTPAIVTASTEVAVLYYMVVTENLFGISVRKNIKLNPNTAENTPHIEYRLKNGAPIRVIVDDGNRSGSWKLRMGNVVCSSNTVGNIKEGVVTVFKNGA